MGFKKKRKNTTTMCPCTPSEFIGCSEQGPMKKE
jgi:hypothetical protein